mmetsp:Transcript_39658/g.84773  ORF Transcript_39658/g.84773 Transcript_39658/m.84773 type:complete len:86 (-) Transcript_39658:1246-1503(-)
MLRQGLGHRPGVVAMDCLGEPGQQSGSSAEFSVNSEGEMRARLIVGRLLQDVRSTPAAASGPERRAPEMARCEEWREDVGRQGVS